MRLREDVVSFINTQLVDPKYKCSRNKGFAFHYGRQELRELLDYIYECEPRNGNEKIL